MIRPDADGAGRPTQDTPKPCVRARPGWVALIAAALAVVMPAGVTLIRPIAVVVWFTPIEVVVYTTLAPPSDARNRIPGPGFRRESWMQTTTSGYESFSVRTGPWVFQLRRYRP